MKVKLPSDPSDPLRNFLDAIPKYLSAEEQRDLARRYRAGDESAGKTLVETNLSWAVNEALRWAERNPVELDDLIAAAYTGLCEAIDRYDPQEACKFLSYAQFWIRSELHQTTRRRHLVRVDRGRDARTILDKFGRTKRELTREFKRPPTSEETAARLGVDHDVLLAHIAATRTASLHVPIFNGSAKEPVFAIDLLTDDQEISAEERVLAKEQVDQFTSLCRRFVRSLDSRERVIWKDRILGSPPEILVNLGARFGVSKERIRQIEMQILADFKDFVKKEME